jgi:hypothetical protein
MKKFLLNSMTKGWFVGNFSPTALKNEGVEVAVKNYNSGDYESEHYHKIATELTLILNGRVRMNGMEYKNGDIVLIEPGESSDFMALTEVTTVVVKVPCVAGDKYLVRSDA